MACWRGVCLLCRSFLEDRLRVQRLVSAPSRCRCDSSARASASNGHTARRTTSWQSLRERLIQTDKEHIEAEYELAKKTLGVGGFGKVCTAVKKATGSSYAVKTIPIKSIASVAAFHKEVDISKSMDHPSIVRLYETFQDHWNVYLVMERCTGGELFDRIVDAGHFNEPQAAALVTQMLQAAAYMHGLGVCHRDIKPENYLFESAGPVDRTPIKLIDFGLSSWVEGGQTMKTAVGTPAYVAPEVFSRDYGLACDLWSVGVVVYILLSGTPPFDADDDKTLLSLVRKGSYDFNGRAWASVSAAAKDLVAGLMQLDPARRLTATQALECAWLAAPGGDAAASALPADLLQNLKTFGEQGRFKQLALTHIAHQLGHQQILSLKRAFLALDADHDGFISASELRDGLWQTGMGVPADLQRIFDAVEGGTDNKVEYTEFLAAAMDARTYTREEICWQAFKSFDLNQDGSITLEEVRMVLQHEDVQGTHELEAVEAALREADLDADGKISASEFMRMMASSQA